MKFRFARHVTTFALSFAFFGCAETDEDSRDALDAEQEILHGPPVTIKIGALDDPGTTPLYGAGVRLAEQQMNQALAALHTNIRFKVLFGDDKGNNASIARTEALRLIQEEGVVAMVSDSSGDSLAVNRLNYDPASPLLKKIPVVCYQCSNGNINNPDAVDADPIAQATLRDTDNWLFRVFYDSDAEADVLAQIITGKPNGGDRDGDGTLEIAVFADAGHTALANALGPTLQTYFSGAVSSTVTVLSTPANHAAQWPTVVAGDPDYVVLAQLPTNVAPAVTSYREGGYTLPLLSNNSFRRNYILPLIGPGANGLEGSSVALVNDDVSGDLFIDAFEAANGGQGPEQTSAGAYDSTATLLLASLVAAREVGPRNVTGAHIRKALTQINKPKGVKIRPSSTSFAVAAVAILAKLPINYEGAYDKINWNPVGDIFPPLVHWTVENNQFVEYESYPTD